MGIPGNEIADHLAKESLMRPVDPSQKIIWSDFKSKTKSYTMQIWQERWNKEEFNKLHEIHPTLEEKSHLCTKNRKQETLLSRLRIGHTWLTHSHLLKREEAPFCVPCNAPFTIKHILTECTDFLPMRENHYTESNITRLFKTVTPQKILDYIKEIGLYNKL